MAKKTEDKAKSKTKAAKRDERENAYPDLQFKLRKSDKGKVGVSVQRFGDVDYLDIRHLFQDKDGNWRPTRKGCVVPLNIAAKLHKKLGKLIKAAEEEGLEIA